MNWTAPSTLTLLVQRLWHVGAFLEPAWAYKEQENYQKPESSSAVSISSQGTARWKEHSHRKDWASSSGCVSSIVFFLSFRQRMRSMQWPYCSYGGEENKVPGVWGRGRCGSRCESCALFQQPRVEAWLSSQCWGQEWCASPKRLSHVSPDHELSANDLHSSLRQPIIHMTLYILKWIIIVLRLKCLMKCLW